MKRWLVSLVALVGVLVSLTLTPSPVVLYAQTAPKIAWAHSGTNVTHFQIQIATNWIVDAGLPTPTNGVYEYTLPALPSGTYNVAVKACYGSDCATSSTLTVVKMVAAGSQALNFYWVDDDGAVTTWANCKSDAPLSGATACTLATATANATAGQVVWLRGGTYTYNVSGGRAFEPASSGSEGSPITFRAYRDESPIIQQANTTNKAIGAYITKSYLRVLGLTFKNFQNKGVWFLDGASHNEFAYCSIVNETAYEAALMGMNVGGYTGPPWSTHNWIHHNHLSTRRHPTDACGESIDLLRVANDATHGGDVSNYNTVEDNYLEYSGHANLTVYSRYNVIRGNFSHNEPWIAGCTSYDGTMPDLAGHTRGSTSTSSVTIGSASGTRAFTVATGLPTGASEWVAGQIVGAYVSTDQSKALWGTIASYDAGTGALVINVYTVSGSGTYASWIVSQRNIPYYTNAAYNGLYSHRVFCLESGYGADLGIPTYNLVEGNRFGFAGVNPNNDGATNLDIGTPHNIIRYNDVYGSMGSGTYMKWAAGTADTGGVRNRWYNNTSYGNGIGWNSKVYGAENNGYASQGMTQYSADSGDTHNQIKNNLVYSNGGGDICYSNQLNPACQPWAGGDTLANNLTGTNPAFVSPLLTSPTSQNLFTSVHGYAATPLPDLRLQAGSAAINVGGALTTAHGADTTSTALHVNDAAYFQDGTLGSDLSRGATVFPDWIAIGTVDNVVAISSIDYATNIITLASAKTWSDNASVWLYKKSDGVVVLVGSQPDAGAHEYGLGTATAPTGVVVR